MVFSVRIGPSPPRESVPRSYAGSADGVQTIHIAPAAGRAVAGVDGESVGSDDLLSLVAPAVVAGVEVLLLLGRQHIEHEELLAPKFPAERALDLRRRSLLGAGGGRKIVRFRRVHTSVAWASRPCIHSPK